MNAEKMSSGENVQITVSILSVPLVLFVFCAVQVYLSLTLKQNLTRNLTFSKM